MDLIHMLLTDPIYRPGLAIALAVAAAGIGATLLSRMF